MNPFLKYTRHLDSCSIMQDWGNYLRITKMCPSFNAPAVIKYMETKLIKSTCTCGLHELINSDALNGKKDK